MKGKYLLLGTNIGERELNLMKARTLLINDNIKIISSSSIYESEPWGIADQPWFLNQVIKVSTLLDPFELLEKVLEIEKKMGRVRMVKWGERLIDIDILFSDNEVINEPPKLTIPHPEIQNRKFTLEPLNELASNETHPALGKTIKELNDNCSDTLTCKKIL